MKARATVRLRLTSEKNLSTVFKALEPETKSPASVRSQARLEREGNILVLKVEAKDSVALRAALNTYLRWINSILNVFQTLERERARETHPLN